MPRPAVPAALYRNLYDCAVATQMFASAALGMQYQRDVDSLYNTGTLACLALSFTHNTVTVGADAMLASALSQEAWYGKAQVPMTDGYSMAWLEHDGRNQYDGFMQDDIALLGGRLHIHPGDKYNYIPMCSNDAAGYCYDFPGEGMRSTCSTSRRSAWIRRSRASGTCMPSSAAPTRLPTSARRICSSARACSRNA